MLNQRQLTLVKLLLEQDQLSTIDSFSRKLHITTRTLQSDLDDIVDYLMSHHLQLVRKSGVGIGIVGSQEAKHAVLNEIHGHKQSLNTMSTHYRRVKILTQLLSSKGETTFQKLSETYFVSKTSIAADIDYCEKWLQDYDITILKDRYGTRIRGDEQDIRHAFAGLIRESEKFNVNQPWLESTHDRIDQLTRFRLVDLFDPNEVAIIENIVMDVEAKLNCSINATSFVILITHLLIMIQRLRGEHALPDESEHPCLSEIVDEFTTNALAMIVHELNQKLNVDLPVSEKKFLALYLLCSGIQTGYNLENIENYITDINDELKQNTKDLVSKISQITHVDLLHDQFLYYGLLLHIKPMLYRLKYQIHVKNTLQTEIKSKYGPLFGILMLLSPFFEEKFNVNVTDDELGYLTIHVQAALERCMSVKRILVVSSEGFGHIQFLVNRIGRFHSTLKIVGAVQEKIVKNVDLRHIDAIISTVPLTGVHLPVITISSMLDEHDLRNIGNYIIEQSFVKCWPKLHNLNHVIEKDLIFLNVKATHKNELITMACAKLRQIGAVSEGFEASVFDRELITPTNLSNGIAIPHGRESFVNASKICIITTHDFIDWGNDRVNIVFVLALNLSKSPSAQHILTDLYNLIDSSDMIDCIRSADKASTLYDKLMSE